MARWASSSASGISSRQIDPEDIDFADVTTEVCDGLPSDVEAHNVSGDRFCPWSLEVIAVDPIR